MSLVCSKCVSGRMSWHWPWHMIFSTWTALRFPPSPLQLLHNNLKSSFSSLNVFARSSSSNRVHGKIQPQSSHKTVFFLRPSFMCRCLHVWHMRSCPCAMRFHDGVEKNDFNGRRTSSPSLASAHCLHGSSMSCGQSFCLRSAFRFSASYQASFDCSRDMFPRRTDMRM